MAYKYYSLKLHSCAVLTLVLSGLLPLKTTYARIQTDGSLGVAQSISGPDYQIHEALGRRAGSNLFHSFSEFTVNTDESATFTGNSEIANVISRVTGGRASTIDGLLKSNIANADFYLINSAGIVFGPNASLSINGSFHASTADYIRLDDGKLFYNDPLQGAILSTAAPAAFGFFGAPDQGITMTGSRLDMEDGRTLSLVGAEVTIKDEARIRIPQGQINLAGVASAGEAVLNTVAERRDLDASAFAQLSPVTVKRGSELNVDSEGGGRVVIRSGQPVLSDSVIYARTRGSQNGNGVDIEADQLRFVRSRIDTNTTSGGHAGEIRIAANALVLDTVDGPEGAGVFANSTGGGGNAGAIAVTADKVDVRGNPDIEATAEPSAEPGILDLSVSILQWNGFAAEFQSAAGRGDLTRLGSGNIVLDGSFDPDLNGVALDGPDYLIGPHLGQVVGTHLFHSFEVLFVDEDETATFFGPESITTIIARVTGDTMTSIYGQLISDIQGAHLYLINPKGLFFGASAWLDLSGSFHISTADYLSLAGGGRFDAQTPANSVLNSSEVNAYGFIDNSIGSIALESTRLLVRNNETLSLVGGNLSLRNESRTIAPSGQVNLVSLQSSGEASVLDNSNDIDVSEFSKLGDVLLDDSAVNVLSNKDDISSPAGRILVRSDDLTLDNNGELRARNFGEGAGGSIDVNIAGSFFVGNGSSVGIRGTGPLGRVSVVANNVTIDGTGQEESFTGFDIAQVKNSSEGDKDNLKLFVTETLNIVNGGVINVSNSSAAEGVRTTIQANNLFIDNGGSRDFTGIFSATEDQGNGGELTITAKEALKIDNGGFINSSTYGVGNGGTVKIQTKRLTVTGNSVIFSSVVLPRSPFDGAGVMEADETTGNGGTLDIFAEEQLQVTNGGLIDTSTLGAGDAGSIKIRTKNLIVDGQESGLATIASSALEESTGNGGDLDIFAEERVHVDSGSFFAFAKKSNAGKLKIAAGNDIYASNSTFSISARQGDFDVNNLDNFTQPELILEAGNSIQLQNSVVTTNAGVPGSKRGAGGDIYLLAPTEIRLVDSILAAQAGYVGGNIFIDPRFYIVINSDVIARADIQGGNYTISVSAPSGWIQSTDSQINLSGRQSGAVLSNTSPFDLGAELNNLESSFLNAEDWALQPCEFRLGGTGSRFLVTGWRGVSNNPDDFLPSEPILLGDNEFSEMDKGYTEFLQEVIFSELADDCNDCP